MVVTLSSVGGGWESEAARQGPGHPESGGKGACQVRGPSCKGM